MTVHTFSIVHTNSRNSTCTHNIHETILIMKVLGCDIHKVKSRVSTKATPTTHGIQLYYEGIQMKNNAIPLNTYAILRTLTSG